MREQADFLNISLIIPTYNGAAQLRQLFLSLRRQTVAPSELLIIDSSSTDETVALARDFGARVTVIARAEFDHGGTRSLAGRQAGGEILVYMTQDALLADPHALARLLAPLQADPSVAVTYGRQLPVAGASFFARQLRTVNYPPVSSRRTFNDRQRYGLRTFFTSNSFAAYRKSALAEVDFFKQGVIFGEDTHTVTKLLQRGYVVEYVAEAQVYHSHNYSVAEEFRRYFDIGVFHATESAFFQALGNPTGEGCKYVLAELAAIWQQHRYVLFAESLIRNISKFIGYHLGRRYHLLPPSLRLMLSMNRQWWLRRAAEGC